MHGTHRLLWALAVAGSACAAPAPDTDTNAPPPDAGVDNAPVLVDVACTASGCLQEVVTIGSFTRAQLEPLLMSGVRIDNGYTVMTVQYATDGRASTATVTLPVEAEAPRGGFPIVVNAHGTIGLDDPCRVSNTVSGGGLAGLFGARGAIGIAPDYPGLGTNGLHAYLSTREEGTSVLDAIRAAKNLARLLDVQTNGRAAVVGLSQGGHAALAAASLHESYAPELDIRAFGAAAPASGYEEQWRPGLRLAGAHVPNFALLVWSWASLAGVPHDMWSDALAPSIDALMTSRCLWSPSFTAEATLGEAIGQEPTEVFTEPFIEAFTSGIWGAWPFMGETFAQNRVVAFSQTAPIRIWQGDADTVVLPWMTHVLVDDLNEAGMDVELVDVAGGTHIDTAFGFVASAERATDDSIAWIQSRLAD